MCFDGNRDDPGPLTALDLTQGAERRALAACGEVGDHVG